MKHYRYPPDQAAQQALIRRVGELNPVPPAAPPVLQNGFITFGCLQTLPKINAGVLAA